jgi:hypothetical protein
VSGTKNCTGRTMLGDRRGRRHTGGPRGNGLLRRHHSGNLGRPRISGTRRSCRSRHAGR